MLLFQHFQMLRRNTTCRLTASIFHMRNYTEQSAVTRN